MRAFLPSESSLSDGPWGGWEPRRNEKLALDRGALTGAPREEREALERVVIRVEVPIRL